MVAKSVQTVEYTICLTDSNIYKEFKIIVPILDKLSRQNLSNTCHDLDTIIEFRQGQMFEILNNLKFTYDIDTCIELIHDTYYGGIDMFNSIFKRHNSNVTCADFVRVFFPNSDTQVPVVKFFIDVTGKKNDNIRYKVRTDAALAGFKFDADFKL